MRHGADVTVAEHAPAGLDIYLGYVDGAYQTYTKLRARFPRALVVGIAVFPSTNAGTVFDGPPDNATWPQVVSWVVMRRRAGVDPTVYTDAADWAIGVQAFNAARVAQPHWWIADWNGVQDIPAGAIGHQYANVSDSYDLSVFADYWPGVDPAPAPAPVSQPAPAPAPAPAAQEEQELIIMSVAQDTASGANPGKWLLSGELYAHIASADDVAALVAQGVKQAAVTYAMHQALVAAGAALQGRLSGSLNVSGTLQAQ